MTDLSQLALTSPAVVRGAVGFVGVVLLVAGARFYKPGLMLAAAAAGGLLTVATLSTMGELIPDMGNPRLLAAAGLVSGAASAWVAHVAHKVALVVIGALTGLCAGAAVSGLLPEAPLWVSVAGGLAGAVVFPWLYEAFIKVVSAAVGAVGLAWAVGMPDSVWLLGVLWTVGSVVQLLGPRPEAADVDEEGQ